MKKSSYASASASSQGTSQAAAKIASLSLPLSQLQSHNYDEICQAMGNAEVVLIGEATHGSEEFYRTRADISKILIEKYGFNFVAVEADFPDANRVNRYVHGSDLKTGDQSAEQSLADFERFPQWMWRNHATKDFVEWLRQFNQQVEQQPSHHHKRVKAGFHGLDLYSLFTSADSVIKYLDSVDKRAADVARNRYGTLGMFRDSSLHDYAYAIDLGLVESQREKVVAMLVDLMKKAPDYIAQRGGGGLADGDEYFFSEQNAKLVKDAEEYYRKSFAGGVVTWNIRDSHMTDTLQALLKYYYWKTEKHRKQLQEVREAHDTGSGSATLSVERAQREEVAPDAAQGVPHVDNPLNIDPALREQKAEKLLSPDVQERLIEGDVTHPVDLAHPPRIRAIVWAHNSHLGDARATEFGAMKECNVGQLARERLGVENTFNVGFTTHHGTVSAAQRWDGARETMDINPGLPGSYEDFLHQATKLMNEARDDQARGQEPAEENGLALLLRSNNPKIHASQDAVKLLMESRIERAIGVQYVKRTERQSHYIRCCLPKQFDFLIHIDETTALRPLD